MGSSGVGLASAGAASTVPVSALVLAPPAHALASGPVARSARRASAPTAPGKDITPCSAAAIVVGACGSRRIWLWIGADHCTRALADAWAKWRRCSPPPTSRASVIQRSVRLAVRSSPTCRQADATSASCSRRTTSAPSPAIARTRGSALTSSCQPAAGRPDHAVQRRPDDQRRGGALRERGDVVRQRLRRGRQRRLGIADAPERALDPQRLRRAAHADPRLREVDGQAPDALGQIVGLEAPGERLEVRVGDRGERPVVVDGQRHVAGRRRVPGEGQRLARRRLSQPGRRAGGEQRHERGQPARPRVQPPRREDPRPPTSRIGVERVGRRPWARELAEHLRVRPRPRLVGRRQLGHRDLEAIEPARRRRRDRPRVPRHDDQRQPGQEATVGVGAHRRQQPGQIGRDELDRGEQVRLGVGRPGDRVDPGDRRRVEADGVARPVQRHRHVHRRAVDRDRHDDRGPPARRRGQGVTGAERPRHAAAHPRQIGGDGGQWCTICSVRATRRQPRSGQQLRRQFTVWPVNAMAVTRSP